MKSEKTELGESLAHVKITDGWKCPYCGSTQYWKRLNQPPVCAKCEKLLY